MKVSNPQRIATNEVLMANKEELPLLFQTLKGSLQTIRAVLLDDPMRILFQTLKGSLQTRQYKLILGRPQ